MEELFNRDRDTHMEHDASDLMNPSTTTQWERDLVESEICTLKELMAHEPDLE